MVFRSEAVAEPTISTIVICEYDFDVRRKSQEEKRPIKFTGATVWVVKEWKEKMNVMCDRHKEATRQNVKRNYTLEHLVDENEVLI